MDGGRSSGVTSGWRVDVCIGSRGPVCPPNKASRAVGRIKRAIVTGAEVGFGEALGIERELQQLLFTSEDAKEGLKAYVDKRQPEFKGK